MKLSQSYFYTLRENVKDEDSLSSNLLVRAGMIKKSSSGVYMLLPLGLKVFNKIENIVREEMENIHSLELSMPALIAEDVFVESGRRDLFGNSMFSLKDRFNKPFVLGPTHEELFVSAAKMAVRSYKDLPISLFQFQTKFRDEPRPRYGLIRVREFVMKDAYTFDTTLEGLDKSYQAMFDAYHRAFKRMGINYVVVKADTGVMGGLLSEEFQALSEIGEDILVLHEPSGYATNLEIAKTVIEENNDESPLRSFEKVHTPNAKTIEEVTQFLDKDIKQFVKTLIYQIDDKLIALCVRGDHEVNETKLQKLFDAKIVELATPEQVLDATKAPIGFAGPVNLDIPVVIDHQLTVMKNFIVGANETDYHLVDVNLHDINVHQIADIHFISEGDMCENGAGPVSFKRGIEIGNTFKLGDKYSKAMDLYYSDENNKLQPVVMGSYGIGVGRVMAALVQQNHSERGILWPKSVAPFTVAIVVINIKDEKQMSVALNLYDTLKAQGVDVVLDDRNERAGVKFNDMELIGAYSRITVGKAVNENKVEFKLQNEAENQLVPIDEIIEKINDLFLGE